MAHTFDTSIYAATSTANPGTFNYTCGVGTTLFALGIHDTATARAGGNPTFGGKSLTMDGRVAFDYGEGSGELWHLINPSTGTQYSVSVPNSGGVTMYLRGSSYKAPTGYSTVYDTSLWTNNPGGTNPSDNIAATNKGVIVQMCSHEGTDSPTAYTHNPILPVDHGIHNPWMQYAFPIATGTLSVGATQASDEYVLITAAFKESIPVVAILKYYNGSIWVECPSSHFRYHSNVTHDSWTVCPVDNLKVYKNSVWGVVRRTG